MGILLKLRTALLVHPAPLYSAVPPGLGIPSARFPALKVRGYIRSVPPDEKYRNLPDAPLPGAPAESRRVSSRRDRPNLAPRFSVGKRDGPLASPVGTAENLPDLLHREPGNGFGRHLHRHLNVVRP